MAAKLSSDSCGTGERFSKRENYSTIRYVDCFPHLSRFETLSEGTVSHPVQQEKLRQTTALSLCMACQCCNKTDKILTYPLTKPTFIIILVHISRFRQRVLLSFLAAMWNTCCYSSYPLFPVYLFMFLSSRGSIRLGRDSTCGVTCVLQMGLNLTSYPLILLL